MSPRKRRLVKWVLIPLVLLVSLVLAVFTWVAYWPLEGDVDDVTALVPVDVEFVYKTSWNGIKASGWLQENVLDRPVAPAVRDALPALEALFDQLEAAEAQINAQIPLGITTFSVEDDILGGDILLAGSFCADSDPQQGLPLLYDWAAFFRVSWRARFVSALKHEFVRSRLGPDFKATEVDEGLYKLERRGIRPTPLRTRQRCGADQVRPPENVFYLLRVKDVLVISNTEALARDVKQLADDPDRARSYLERPRVSLEAPSNAVAASVDLLPLRPYLIRSLEMAGAPYTIIRRYLTVNALDRMNGRLVLPTKDSLRGEAEIRYTPGGLARGIEEVYELPPVPLGQSVATLLPASDTFGVLLLRTPALQLIDGIYEEILDADARKLWNDNLRRMGGYQDIQEFFREFAGNLGDTAGIAVGRMSETYDAIEYPGFYTDPVTHPDPNWPALALMVRLKSSTKPAEFDEYLAERVPLLGGSKELEKVEYRGLTYTRVRLEVEFADLANVTPAYILAQDHFVFCSNEEFFRRILDTMIDPKGSPPLSTDPTFRATAFHLPETAHLAFFLDIEKLTRIPESTTPGAQPRGFLWDQRNMWVTQNRDARDEAIRYRKERLKEIALRGQGPATRQQRIEIERQVDEYATRWEERYPAFEEEYRLHLKGLRRFRSFGLGIRSESPVLVTRLVGLLREEADAGGPE